MWPTRAQCDGAAARNQLNLEKAIGTAKYANHAKAERIGREERFSQWVNVLVHSTPFPFAYLACFAVGIGRLRMNRDIVPQGNKKEPADKCLRPARQSRAPRADTGGGMCLAKVVRATRRSELQ